MVILIKTLQVILALSLLILVHELGHFMWAKIFGIRVEKFYLFFDIGGKAIVRWKWGGTEFGIGWLPFGGYCKISGMIDESMDLEQMRKEPEQWEFRSHPAWQRLLVMAGGVLNNFIFAVLAYILIMASWGQSYVDNSDSRIYVNDLAYEMGFRTGDRILKFDDYVLNSPMMFDLAVPFVVDSIAAGPNTSSGLRRGDRIIAFGGTGVEYLQDSRPVLAGMKDSLVAATVVRGGDTLSVPVRVDTSGRIGVYMQMPSVKVKHYSLLSAIPAGIKLTGSTIGGYVRDLGLLVRPSTGAYKSVGSFIAIGQVFPSTWDWYRFINILALLSIMLAVMNLIPIPALDGGHILFTLYEILTGRKPGEKFLVVAQVIGMALLFALMFLAFGNDLTRIL